MKRLIKHTDIHLRIRTLIGEAGRETRAATQTDQDGERIIKHTDIHLRIRTLIGEAGRETRAATQTDQDGERFRL